MTIDLHHRLRGLWLPLVTPFHDGELDERSLRRLLTHYASTPLDGLILAATSGEGMSLTPDELRRIVDTAHATLSDGGRTLPICLGLSGASTRDVMASLDRTAAWPIDGYLIPSPHYVRPSQRGLREHFTALGDHAARPLVLYNIPYRTGVDLDNETLLDLAEHPNIVGIKDCRTDRARSVEFLERRPRDFRVLTGEDLRYHEALEDGADGAILVSAHLCTETFARVRTLLHEGRSESARACWEDIAVLTRLLFSEPSPAPVKHWLARTGLIDTAEVRLPMVGVSAGVAARLDAERERRARSGSGSPDH